MTTTQHDNKQTAIKIVKPRLYYENKNQRIYYGDCVDVLKLIPSASVRLILQDPPYNVTACDWEWDIFKKIDYFWSEWRRVLMPRGAIIMTATQPFASHLIMSNLKMFKYEWIWDKVRSSGFQIVKYRPMMRHENVLVFSEKLLYNPIMTQFEKPRKYKARSSSSSSPLKYMEKDKSYISNEGYPNSILRFFKKINSKKILTNIAHSTQKPVELFEYLIRTYTNENDVVLDCFLGSGTTLLACLNTNRKGIGVELDAKYCNISKLRIERNDTKPVKQLIKMRDAK